MPRSNAGASLLAELLLSKYLYHTGAVQTDGYEACSIYENKKGILLLGCWAHARRKFSDSLAEDKARAEYALEQIGLLVLWLP